jgi:hypothetical protein
VTEIPLRITDNRTKPNLQKLLFGLFCQGLSTSRPDGVLIATVARFYPKPGNGPPPVGVKRMLRLYFLQQWFNLSDLIT